MQCISQAIRRCFRIARCALPSLSAMAGKFGSIDAQQANAFAGTIERITVHHTTVGERVAGTGRWIFRPN